MHNMAFNELWHSLSEENKARLKQKLMRRCNVGDSTVYMWGRGIRHTEVSQQANHRDVVRTMFRIKATNLFPENWTTMTTIPDQLRQLIMEAADIAVAKYAVKLLPTVDDVSQRQLYRDFGQAWVDKQIATGRQEFSFRRRGNSQAV